MDSFSFWLEATFNVTLGDEPPHADAADMTATPRASNATFVTNRIPLISSTSLVVPCEPAQPEYPARREADSSPSPQLTAGRSVGTGPKPGVAALSGHVE